MSEKEIIFNPVDHITTDAIGAPGKRVFYLQAWKGERTLTLLIEKFQIQSMAAGVEQFLNELAERYPDLPDASADYNENTMHIHPPVDPLFRVGDLGLSYDMDNDMVSLIIREMLSSNKQPEEAASARLYCTRAQIKALVSWGLVVADRGRRICPYCGEPEDPSGHICPKKNGKNG
ncbi:MAG: DUF3090 domain-containing protein [Chloroflexi bacterium]|nr:DUF3090 domain-containing protein [Chloroflexota bacterium]